MTKNASQGSINQQIFPFIPERILSELPEPPLSKRSRKVASEIAQIKERIQADKLKNPTPAQPGVQNPVPYLATGPVKAKRLRIAPGYT